MADRSAASRKAWIRRNLGRGVPQGTKSRAGASATRLGAAVRSARLKPKKVHGQSGWLTDSYGGFYTSGGG